MNCVFQQSGQACAENHADNSAQRAKRHRLDQKLHEDVATLRADRFTNADLARPLGHADEHDVHHADSANQQTH